MKITKRITKEKAFNVSDEFEFFEASLVLLVFYYFVSFRFVFFHFSSYFDRIFYAMSDIRHTKKANDDIKAKNYY